MSNISLASIFHRSNGEAHPHEVAPELEKANHDDMADDESPTKSKGDKRLSRHAHFVDPEDETPVNEDPEIRNVPTMTAPVIDPAEPQTPSRPEPAALLQIPTPNTQLPSPGSQMSPASYVMSPEDPFVTHRRASDANHSLDMRPVSPGHSMETRNPGLVYTNFYRDAAPKSYTHTLKPYSGRLSNDSWHRIAVRPFILFAYPAILWSATVYALSVGWLIVLSESVSVIYENSASYNFTSLQVGLVYISPFVGGILGTAVAGKFSDVIVRFMSRRNGGIYEPEFRLVMAIPVALSTAIGLMGYGWSAQERDAWIVPTLFFGIISFGCCVGSTTAITFAVDSYRQYAGEALVTLNFSKSKPSELNVEYIKLTFHRCLPRPSLLPLLQ